MITLEEIVKLDAWKQLTAEGRQYVQNAVASGPARLVGVGGLMNQSGLYASLRCEHTLQWESRTVELVFLHKAELDPQVICIWDQPPPLSIVKHDRRGHRCPSRWTPDYLVLRSQKFVISECKPFDRLADLEQSERGDWVQRDGAWTWNPGAVVCGRLGVEFSLFHSGMYSRVLAGNLTALVTASRQELSNEQLSTLRTIRKALLNSPLSHATLLIRYAKATGDLLLQGLIAGELHGALSSSLLGENFLYYYSAEDARSRERMVVDVAVTKEGAVGDLAQRLIAASKAEIERAETALSGYLQAREANQPLNSTGYRYKTKLEQAHAEGVPALAAFIHRAGDRGRRPYIHDDCVKLMEKTAHGYIKDSPKPTLTFAYSEFLNKSSEINMYQPSLETFRKYYNTVLTPERRALQSRGKRGFHAERASTDPRDRAVEPPIPGLFAHIDCTPADVVATHDEEIGDWPRPIVIPLIDQESGYVLGRGYVFGSTSRLAPAIALNDAVSRNGCLTANISFDGGSEFNNQYLKRTLAALAVNAIYRPKSGAQWGARVEAFFARLNAFLQQLFGGLANDKMGRSSDGKKKGRRRAVYEIAELIRIIDHWIFEIYNKQPAKDESLSPIDLWSQGRTTFPSCCKSFNYDRAFRLVTAVEVGRVRRDTWNRKKGVRFGGTTFSSVELAAAHLQGAKLNQIRLDAVDPTLMYVATSLGTIIAFASSHGALAREDPSILLAEHVSLIEYHARAKENQIATKRKEAAFLKRTQQASRFCLGENERDPHSDLVSSSPDREEADDEFDSIEASDIPIYKLR